MQDTHSNFTSREISILYLRTHTHTKKQQLRTWGGISIDYIFGNLPRDCFLPVKESLSSACAGKQPGGSQESGKLLLKQGTKSRLDVLIGYQVVGKYGCLNVKELHYDCIDPKLLQRIKNNRGREDILSINRSLFIFIFFVSAVILYSQCSTERTRNERLWDQ